MKITKGMRAWWSENGRKAGKVGGPARAASLSPERRKAISALAIKVRWEKVRLARDQAEQ